MDFNLREMVGNLFPQRTKTRRVKVSEARELLLQDELFMKLQSSVPKELIFQRELLSARL